MPQLYTIMDLIDNGKTMLLDGTISNGSCSGHSELKGMMMSDQTLDVAEITEIRRLLPHRYPFLLVDRITDIRGADHGTGIRNLTMNEWQFGHSESPSCRVCW